MLWSLEAVGTDRVLVNLGFVLARRAELRADRRKRDKGLGAVSHVRVF